MKKFLKRLSTLVFLVFVVGAATFYFAPGFVVNGMQTLTAERSGLALNSIDLDGYQAHYLEGGANNGKVLVLLHGLAADKHAFVSSAAELAKEYRVILPDLQAHGNNQALKGRDYSISGQVAFLNKLFESINVRSFVIGGNSMGGHISTAFTFTHPEKVKGLVVINATGMQLENEAVYQPFPDTVDRAFFKNTFSSLFVTPPNFPAPIVSYMVEQLNAKIPVLNDMVDQVQSSDDFRLNEKAQNIRVPSLIIWGNQDKLTPLTYAEKFNTQLSDSKLVVVEQAGHFPQFEKPKIVQTAIAEFLETVN